MLWLILYKKNVLTKAVKGSGGYFSDIGQGVGGVVDGVAGLASGVGKLFGFGDYGSKNGGYRSRAAARQAAYSVGGMSGAYPEATTGFGENPNPGLMGSATAKFENHSTLVPHREIVMDITGSNDFHTELVDVNPGSRTNTAAAGLAKWLPNVAQNYQQYRIRGMIFEFVSSVTALTSDSELGFAFMSTLYDADAAALADKDQVGDNEFTTMNKISQSFIHPIECKKGSNAIDWRYIDNSVEVSTSDPRWNDYALFQVSTIDQPTALVGKKIGILYVTYLVEFKKPTLPIGILLQSSSYYCYSSEDAICVCENIIPHPSNNLNASLIVNGAGSIFDIGLPSDQPGSYMISIISINSPNTPLTPVTHISQDTGITPYNALWNQFNNFTLPPTNSTYVSSNTTNTSGGYSESSTFFFNYDGTSGANISFQGGVPAPFLSHLVAYNIFITTVNPSLTETVIPPTINSSLVSFKNSNSFEIDTNYDLLREYARQRDSRRHTVKNCFLAAAGKWYHNFDEAVQSLLVAGDFFNFHRLLTSKYRHVKRSSLDPAIKKIWQTRHSTIFKIDAAEEMTKIDQLEDGAVAALAKQLNVSSSSSISNQSKSSANLNLREDQRSIDYKKFCAFIAKEKEVNENTFALMRKNISSSSSSVHPSTPILVEEVSDDDISNLSPPPEVEQLSMSYITRVGEALGVKKSSSLKK